MTSERWWHVFFAARMLVCAALAVFAWAPDRGHRVTALAVVLVLSVCYATVGRLSFSSRRVATAIVPVMIVGTFVVVGSVPITAVIQCIVCPLIWFTLPRPRPAMVATVALTAGTAVVLFHVLGGGGEAYLQSLVAEAFTLAGSLALGLWITREGRLSEERRHLVEELTATQHQLVGLHRAAGVAAERQRWSREVHDTIAQSLTSVVMQTERARRSYAADQTASLAGQLGLLEDSARELCSRPAPWWPPAHHPA